MKNLPMKVLQESVEAIIAASQHPTDQVEEEKKEEMPEKKEIPAEEKEDHPGDEEQEQTLLTDLPCVPQEFKPPSRVDYGSEGREISLRVNYFRIHVPAIKVFHYHIEVVPDVARKMNRIIIGKLINTFYTIFENSGAVYDGRNNMYTRNLLPIEMTKFDVTPPNESGSFSVFLTYRGIIDTAMIEEDVKAKRAFLSPEATHAIDVILRHLSSIKYTPYGKCFFAPPGAGALGHPAYGMPNLLGYGRELWFGFHQSLYRTQSSLQVNVDTTTTAFYNEVSVIEFLATVLDLPVQALTHRVSLSDAQRIRFAREIKSMKIEVTHCGAMRRKYRVCNVTRKPVHLQTFLLSLENDGCVEVTVEKYFYEKYNLELKYPHLPCLHVGSEKKSTFLPLEVCRLVAGQRCNKRLNDSQTSLMIRASQKTAPERETEILGLVHKAQICVDSCARDYGISVSPMMTEVTGRVLSAPKLLYGVNARQQHHYQTVLPSNGAWDMRGKKLHSGIEVDSWALVSFAQQVSEGELRYFAQELQNVSREAGMPLRSFPCFCKYASGAEHVEPMFKFIRARYPDIQIVVVVLPGKTAIYSEVKKVGDTLLGLPTQCVAVRNVMKPTTQSLSNLCLKMNVKMGGTNTVVLPVVRPKIFEEPVIFIGANVTHPHAAEHANRRPTICAVVGSMDAHPSRYAATVRLQPERVEMISEMSDMIRELLIKFRRSTGFRPMRIVMYRTGVSEGQYYNVLQYELRAIREACMKLESNYQPGVTYMTVQKRHHTRLFAADPKDYTGKANNVPAGTTVDTGITHPSQNEFYLCSHAGIQGTSRPSRYHVLWDDNQLNSDDLQQLTYQLCHTYARCTRAVSIPAPAYYAHLVSFRARHHLCDRSTTDSSFGESLYSTTSSEVVSTMSQMAKAVEVHPASSKVMYYA